ncbi:MAG: hypothetical protein ACR2QR_01240 [Woeseiaceae bacterium]
MSNHVDRFYAAVSVVASHGNIKQRLISAFEEHLAEIEDVELPRSVREKFIKLRAMVTGVEPLNGEGHIRATVRKMSVDEADACSRKMLDLYTDMVHLEGDLDESPINIGDQPRIPPFLVKSLNS